MPDLKKKKISLIGLGNISQVYLDIIPQFNDVVLYSVVEPNVLQLKKHLIPDVRIFHTVEDMLTNGSKPDIAIVCSPPSSHGILAEMLLKAGVDCLIEKPIAINVDESKRIVFIAEELGRKISTSAKFRVTPALLKMQNYIHNGIIGALNSLECTFSSVLNVRDNWRSHQEISGGGVWMDNGPHAIDVIETMAGAIKKIRIVETFFEQKLSVEDEVCVEAEHENHVHSTMRLSWNRQIKVPYVRCTGSEGELFADWHETILYKQNKKEVIFGGYDKQTSFRNVLQSFLDHHSSTKKMIDQGQRTMSWIHAGYRSIHTNQWETIHES